MKKTINEKILEEFKLFIDEKTEEFYLMMNEIFDSENLLKCNICKNRYECDLGIGYIIKNGCKLFLKE